MKLTDKQVERYEKAWIEHLKLEKELAYAEVAGEVKETEEKTESALSMSILALLGTAILSGFLFKLMLNLGAAKFILLLLAAVGIGALVFSVRLIIRNGFSFEKKEEVVEGEPIDEEELD